MDFKEVRKRISETLARIIEVMDDYLDEMVDSVVRLRYSEDEEEYTSDEY